MLDWCREGHVHTTMQSVHQRALSACDRRVSTHILLLCCQLLQLKVKGHITQILSDLHSEWWKTAFLVRRSHCGDA